MSNNTLKTIGVIFLLLVAALAVRMYMPGLAANQSPYLKNTENFSPENITALTIEKNSAKLEIKKENNTWTLDSKKADSEKISSLIAALLPKTAPELVAETDRQHGELELTASTAARINLDSKADILLGKTGGGGTYARFYDEAAVYVLTGVPYIATEAGQWYDKTISKFDRTKATKLTLKDPSSTVSVEKKDDTWVHAADQQEADKDKVEAILSPLSLFTAQSLFENTSKTAYPVTPALSITVDYDGKTETLEFFKGPSDYLVKRSSDTEQFIAAEYAVTPFLDAVKNLR